MLLVRTALEGQFVASNTLRGVARDATFIIEPLAAHVRGAPAAVGL